jgi:hypothetical protein
MRWMVHARALIRRRTPMRVSSIYLKSVAFIAEIVQSTPMGDEFDHYATGFFVTIRSEVDPGRSWAHFITARHVAEGLRDFAKVALIVNSRSGNGITTVPIAHNQWFFHPSDESADVAILPVQLTPDLDVLPLELENFATPKVLTDLKMGLGDDIVIPGLFQFAPGTRKDGVAQNMPIVGRGNVAMIPDAPIQVDNGFAEVYLVEAHSIGGLSGSPVFIRGTLADPIKPVNAKEDFLGVSSTPYLLGLMHGHWDIPSSEIDRPVRHLIHDPRHGVNMGIAVVVPAYKIIEALHHPELVAMRFAEESEFGKSISPQPDSGVE